MRDPVSPAECQHPRRLFVCGSRGSPPPQRYHVSVCRDCGQFEVFTEKNGQHLSLRFELPTDELVEAAGQFARLLAAEEAAPKSRGG